jgi:hypothetical protein
MAAPRRIWSSKPGHILLAVAASSVPAVAQASSIGLQFLGDSGNSVGTPIPSNQNAGVVPQMYWNSYPGTFAGVAATQRSQTITSGVTDSGNNASGLTFTFGYENGASITDNNAGYTDTGAKDLYSGFLSSTSSDNVYVDLNIPASYQASGYAVYVYALRKGTIPSEVAGINTTGSFTVFDQSQTITGSTNATTYVNGLNYVEFTGLSSATLDVVLTEPPASTGYLTAVQIVQTPEPASLGALALAGGGLLMRRRRRGARGSNERLCHRRNAK